MDVIFLLILSALTSGPLGIQGHMKALQRLGQSTPSDSSESHYPPSTMIFVAGLSFMPIFLFIIHGNFADPKIDGTVQPASIVMIDTAMMCILMLMLILGMGGIWLHNFYRRVTGNWRSLS